MIAAAPDRRVAALDLACALRLRLTPDRPAPRSGTSANGASRFAAIDQNDAVGLRIFVLIRVYA